MESFRDLSWLQLCYHQYMASMFAIVRHSSQPGAKRFRGVCVGYFDRSGLMKGVHSLNTYYIGQNSVNWLPLITGKTVNIVKPGFQEEEMNCWEYSHQGSREKIPSLGMQRLGFQSWWSITKSHLTSFSSENQNQSPLLLSTPQGNLRSKLEWNKVCGYA